MKKLIPILLCSLVSAGLTAQNSVRTGKDRAVFFYTTTYEPGWPALPETEAEAEKIAKELEDNYGFSVELVANPTKTAIRDKMLELNRLDYDSLDQLLVYFTSHGHFIESADRGYLIPSDGKTPESDPFGETWLSYEDLGTYLAPNPCEHILLLLDACYSGAFGDRWKSNPGIVKEYEDNKCKVKEAEKALARQTRFYFTSGSREQRVPAQSKFAAHWLMALYEGQNEKVIDINLLGSYFGRIKNPNPIPEGGFFSEGHKGGDFIFVHNTACTDSEPETINTSGAFDRDLDGFPDDQDECPDEFGTAKGCLDTDDDGVPDKKDFCPYVKGIVERNGCPPPTDTDGDSVPDPVDKCPRKAGPRNYQGCPDSDNDLVPDHLDECPEMKGHPDNKGCLLNMVFVEGGHFELGPDLGYDEEVRLDDYYMGTYEVTVKEYLDYLYATGSEITLQDSFIFGYDLNNLFELEEFNFEEMEEALMKEDHPITGISWYDAIAYCNWRSEYEGLQQVYSIVGDSVNANWEALGYRLPTEAEWEVAASSRKNGDIWAGTSSDTSLSAYSNFCDINCIKRTNQDSLVVGQNDGYLYTSPVGSYMPNKLGLYDMSGNVSEWCWNWWYGSYYYFDKSNDHTDYISGRSKIIRGGSCLSDPEELQCSFRGNEYSHPAPSDIGYLLGFRLAMSAVITSNPLK